MIKYSAGEKVHRAALNAGRSFVFLGNYFARGIELIKIEPEER
jgi:hypothetical protein